MAGEWYEWFVVRHPLRDAETWEDLRDRVHEALKETVGDDAWERSHPDGLWSQDEDVRREVRPVLADVGETAQFLAVKGLRLNSEARDRFLDWLYDDLAAALRKLLRVAQGDYRDDKYAERFPKFAAADSGDTPQQLFDKWVAEKQPAWNTEVAAIRTVHRRIIAQLTARGQTRERYAALRNRARTQTAHDLIAGIRDDMQELEQTQGKRIYKRRAVSDAKFVGAIERFVGDLLRVRAGTTGMANIHRALGSSRFADDNVKYDMFTKVLEGLKTLGLVGHQKGQSRYRKTPFGNASEPGHAARFWATSKLLGLAAHYGIHDKNIADHSPLSHQRTHWS